MMYGGRALRTVVWMLLSASLHGQCRGQIATVTESRAHWISEFEKLRPGEALAVSGPMAWQVRDVFGSFRFHELSYVVRGPRDHVRLQGQLCIVCRRGKIFALRDGMQPSEEPDPFLDLSDRLSQSPDSDDNLLCLTFHPDFATPSSTHSGELFVFYTTSIAGPSRYRLSRLRWPASATSVSPESEVVLIEQEVPQRSHVGGCLQFGPDGMLYVSVGDGGGDHDDQKHAQRIDRSLFSGILRLDVNESETSRLPRRQPDKGQTQIYRIPDDNPFMGIPNALEEFWAIGVRNPHQMAFDPDTGELWFGDVGQDRFEEVNIASRGSNHEWSYREGREVFPASSLAGKPPSPHTGVPSPPLYRYRHSDLDNCVIGGRVYRGRRFPELRGRFVFADHGSGRVWALTTPEDGEPERELLLRIPTDAGNIVSFGEDNEGELLLCLWIWNRKSCRVVRLDRAQSNVLDLWPARLSETGLFADVQQLRPDVSLIPYEVNVAFWSDGARKRRWIRPPPQIASDSTLRFHTSREGDWRFPAGTVFVKHFDEPSADDAGSAYRPLETRILVRTGEEGVAGVTYRWNSEGTDALRVDRTTWRNDDDSKEIPGNWCFPGPTDCSACHTRPAGYILGVHCSIEPRDTGLSGC